MEPKALFNALTVYRERGLYLRRLEQFDSSKVAYDEAFNNSPDDVKNLTGRSQLCSDAMQPQQAYADAELALKLEPRNMIAKNMQARAMYTMSDFERSVVINFRGSWYRKKPAYFIEGINQGLETLKDCIGENAGQVMLDLLPTIKTLETSQHENKRTPHLPHLDRCRIPKPKEKKRLTQMEARQALILSRVLAMKYLGPMAYDKFFLSALMEDPRVMSANLTGSMELRTIIGDAFRSLSERQEMLRSQRPYYTIKLAEKSVSKYQTKFKEATLIAERVIGARTAERYLKNISNSTKACRVNDVISQAERMQAFLDTKTPRTLPDKDIYTDRLYKTIGEAYLSQHRLSYNLSELGNRRRIAFLMGIPVGRAQHFDSVISSFPLKFVDINETKEKLMKNLEMCENDYMKCCLQYEMARLLCSQKNYALAKFYSKRCQKDAEEIGSVTWWLNGCFVLMSGDLQQGNVNEVRMQVQEAYEWSKKMKDPERVQAFLAKCAEMAEEPLSADELKAIKQRERQILQAMDEKIRVETSVLFKRMSTVPADRRFAVLPTKTMLQETRPVRKLLRQVGLTVVPGKPVALPRPPKSKTAGYQLFDI